MNNHTIIAAAAALALLGGCGGKAANDAPAAVTKAGSSQAVQVTTPPAYLNVPAYYTKYLDASGVPIVAHSTVADAALFKMKTIVDTMLWKDSYTRQQVVANLRRVLIIPKNDGMTTLPEYATLDQTNPIPGSTWNERAQGVGWTQAIPYMSCSEANLLHSGWPQDRYTDESICIHEFAHAVWDAGIVYRDTGAQARLEKLWKADLDRGFLGTTYSSQNSREYWAEGVQAWFNAASCTNTNTTPTCTHNSLYWYDYPLWAEVGKWFYAPYQLTTQIYP